MIVNTIKIQELSVAVPGALIHSSIPCIQKPDNEQLMSFLNIDHLLFSHLYR